MDEQLKLIEAYYAAAADMRARGLHMVDIAEMLARIADQMSEQRARSMAAVSAGDEQK